MLNAIKQFFSCAVHESDPFEYQRAVAALLLEVVIADHNILQEEEAQVKASLVKITGESADAEQLYQEVKSNIEDAHDAYQFTKIINEHASLDEKLELLRNLWRVAYSDGNLDAHEDHRIRKISDLLFMPHSEFIQTKLQVLAELNLSPR